MKAKLSRQMLNKTVSGLLVLWLSGLMFLFCCEMPVAQAAASEPDTCPLAKKNHCNKAAETTGNEKEVPPFASLQSNGQALDCCRLMPSIFDKARKIESNPLPVAQATAQIVKISAPAGSSIQPKTAPARFYHPLVPDRGGTYLKNRTLRI